MAVKLTKEPRLPECTPVHIIDEEDTIVRVKSSIDYATTDEYKGSDVEVIDAEVLNAPHGELGTVLTIEKRKEALLSEVRGLSPDAQIAFCEQAIEELKDVRVKAREMQNPLLAHLGMILLRFGIAIVLTGFFAFFGEPVKAILLEMLGEAGAILYTVSHIATTLAAVALCGSSIKQMLQLTLPCMSPETIFKNQK